VAVVMRDSENSMMIVGCCTHAGAMSRSSLDDSEFMPSVQMQIGALNHFTTKA